MLQSDQNFAIETASNAVRAQEKSEQAGYHKGLAHAVKQELDAHKGYSSKHHSAAVIINPSSPAATHITTLSAHTRHRIAAMLLCCALLVVCCAHAVCAQLCHPPVVVFLFLLCCVDITCVAVVRCRGTWNVIVGKSFGAFVTHETKT